MLEKLAHESDTAASGDRSDISAETYDRLRRLAHRYLNSERSGHTLQPTALVNEAYARILSSRHTLGLENDIFLSLAARTMRFVLVDHARKRRAQRRGGDCSRVPLDDAVDRYQQSTIDLLVLDEALDALARLNPELAQTVELRFFGGLDEKEIASEMNIATRTVRRNWRAARTWLAGQLTSE